MPLLKKIRSIFVQSVLIMRKMIFCNICASEKADATTICVAIEPRDIPPIERTGSFNGVYHVLGALVPFEA